MYKVNFYSNCVKITHFVEWFCDLGATKTKEMPTVSYQVTDGPSSLIATDICHQSQILLC